MHELSIALDILDNVKRVIPPGSLRVSRVNVRAGEAERENEYCGHRVAKERMDQS